MYLNLHWVIGVTAVGKTHYVEQIGESSEDLCIYTGKMARKALGAEAMAKMENPTAPEQIEDAVRGMVFRALASEVIDRHQLGFSITSAWIDSMPRNPAQGMWCINEMGAALKRELSHVKIDLRINHEILLVTCNKETHENRIKERMAKAGGHCELLSSRLVKDKLALFDVLSWATGGPVPIRKIDVSSF